MAAIKGMRQAINQLRRLREDSANATRQVLSEVGDTILAEAKAAAPRKDGALISSGGKELPEDRLSVVVYFGAKHAPYIEFGTGPFVEVPNGYEDYAMTFFVNGKGHGRPHPFLFPAGLRASAIVMAKLEDAFNKLNK